MHRRLIGVAMSAMRRIMVTGLMRRMDRHALEARLFQMDRARLRAG